MNSTLTVGQRALLRAELEQRRHQLERRLREHLGGLTRAEHAHEVLVQDGDDAPQREGEREIDMALSEFETQELARVRDALSRLDEARFGLCVSCEQTIPFDRLRAEPWALRCVACESLREAAPGR